jgi:type III secretion protein R
VADHRIFLKFFSLNSRFHMSINLSNPFEVIVILSALSLLPFLAVMLTSFTKIIVVLGILRNALGLQSTPPNMVLNGLSIIMSCFIMYPVLDETTKILETKDFSQVTIKNVTEAWKDASRPVAGFLKDNSRVEMRQFFLSVARRTWPSPYREAVTENDILVLIPSFVVSELSTAFQIGFIIFLPFIIIDLVVSNILMALGIVMIAPTSISLPFKLLLFFLVDGWRRLLEGLILTYHIPPLT